MNMNQQYPKELVDAIARELSARFTDPWDSLDHDDKYQVRVDAVTALEAISDRGAL